MWFAYIAAGGQENENIITSLSRIKSQLNAKNINNFKWHTALLEDESHGTAPIVGHYLALRKLFTNWDKPNKKLPTNELNVFIEQIELRSSELNPHFNPDESTLNWYGYFLLEKNKFTQAIAAFKQNIYYYPQSANAYDSLADGLEKQGRLIEALKNMEKSVALVNDKNPDYDMNTEHYRKLKMKMTKNQ